MMKNKIKLFDPKIGKEEEIALIKTLKSGFWASGSGGGNVAEFENKFSKYVNSKNCITVNSGTAALHLALSLFDIKGKEVILPSLSFATTAHAVIYNGGIPKFVDVDPTTLCIDPDSIENAITSRTKLILPVHFAGFPSEMNKIQKICKVNNLKLVEDAAHAAGTLYKKKKIGSHGNAVCFSFHPVKNLAMPTGGAITINDKNYKKFEKVLKMRRWCGITDRKGVEYDVKEAGWNFYMNEFSAAVGLEQLKKLDFLNKIKKKIAKIYANEINVFEKMPYNKDSSYHIYWILVKNRKKFMKKMLENGIETGIHYKPIHEMSYYKKKIHLDVTESVGKEIVTIPIHANLSNNDVTRIVNTINKILDE